MQRADLYVPKKGEPPFAVAVAIHGGYWRARYSKRIQKPVATDLVRRGLAVWNIEYRRLGRGQGGGWPATFDDVAAAIDYLAELNDPRLDLERVTAFGHSAGGQLALWAASRKDGRVRIRRVCAQAGVCDLASAGGAARELMGGSPDEVPERYAQADPMQLVPLGVPILLVHGAQDETVPVKRSRRFAEAARAAGDDVTLVDPNPGGHRVHVDPRTEAWEIAARWIASPYPARAMKLYICWGTFPSPRRPGGHPCRNAYQALRKAGHEPEVIKSYGLTILPGPFNATEGRREAKRLTGKYTVPVLVTDDDEVVADSKNIVAWAEKNPAV